MACFERAAANLLCAGVIICIIDSGFDGLHPDLINNTVDGCKYEDAYAPGGCPFPWSRDFVGHGTHVAGRFSKLQGPGLKIGSLSVWPKSSFANQVAVHGRTACAALRYTAGWKGL
jgi:subtilisin family serine protease